MAEEEDASEIARLMDDFWDLSAMATEYVARSCLQLHTTSHQASPVEFQAIVLDAQKSFCFRLSNKQQDGA